MFQAHSILRPVFLLVNLALNANAGESLVMVKGHPQDRQISGL